jgi:hypothetical protein
LNSATGNACYINPIRTESNVVTSDFFPLYYKSTTSEICKSSTNCSPSINVNQLTLDGGGYPIFVPASGCQTPQYSTGLRYVNDTQTLTVQNLVGNVTGNASSATQVNITNTTASALTFYPVFASSSGLQNLNIDTSNYLNYIPSNDLLTVGIIKPFQLRDDANSIGTAGQVLSSTGSALSWIAPPSTKTFTEIVNPLVDSAGNAFVLDTNKSYTCLINGVHYINYNCRYTSIGTAVGTNTVRLKLPTGVTSNSLSRSYGGMTLTGMTTEGYQIVCSTGSTFCTIQTPASVNITVTTLGPAIKHIIGSIVIIPA